jgi:F-type H+-transporting ATPase subunit a
MIAAAWGLADNPVITDEFHRPTTELFQWPCITDPVRILGIDFCLNRVIILLLAATFVAGLLFFLAFRKPKLVPGKFQSLMEMGVEFIRNQVIVQTIGPEGIKYLPYFTALFFFIFFGNILEVIPGINFPVNSRIAFPMVLAILSWVIYNYAGIRAQGFAGYVKSVLFPPGAPKLMYILLTPIEFFSVIVVRPITLTIRLMANMVAGHLLLTVFFIGTAFLLSNVVTVTFSIFSFGLAIALVGFEVFVATLQAFIFSILTASYIAGAAHPEH